MVKAIAYVAYVDHAYALISIRFPTPKNYLALRASNIANRLTNRVNITNNHS